MSHILLELIELQLAHQKHCILHNGMIEFVEDSKGEYLFNF